MSRLRIGVVGAGHLGRIHARLLASLPEFELAAIADSVTASAESLAKDYQAPAFGDYRKIIGLVDAAVVATPTITHHAVGLDLLKAGLHVFIEKPLAPTLREAHDLVRAAETAGRILQVGHVERFNPAFAAAAPVLERPQYIEAQRTSGYTFRSTDIGVVLDLMIHDIDLALALAQSDVERVDALGMAIFGRHEDVAQARLVFANGCVANLTASRASYVATRQMQAFSATAFAALDFAKPALKIVRPSEAIVTGAIDFEGLSTAEKQACRDNLFVDHLRLEEISLEGRNAIRDELRDFAASVAWNCQPRVDGRQGCHAVAVAEQVLNAISRHRWNIGHADLMGPRIFAPPAEQHADDELNRERQAA